MARHLAFLLFEADALALVAPVSDPIYVEWLAERAAHIGSYNQVAALLLPAAAGCLALCLLRAVWVRGVLQAWARGGGGGGAGGKAAEAGAAKEDGAAGGNFGSEQEGAPLPASAYDAPRGLAPGKAAPRLAPPPASAPAAPSAPTAPEPLAGLRWAESCWTLAGGVILLLWSWACVAFSNGDCPRLPSLDTTACLAGWPLLPLGTGVLPYYAAEAAWYGHLLLKSHLGIGLPDSPLLVAHHGATLALLALSYAFSLHRPAVLALALLNASNPLLHLAKAAHQAGSKRLATCALGAFAAVFAATRAVLFPLMFAPLVLIQARASIPRLTEHYPGVYGTILVLLGALMVMQWAWLAAILRAVRHAASGQSGRLEASAHSMERAAASPPASAPGSASAACLPALIPASTAPCCQKRRTNGGGVAAAAASKDGDGSPQDVALQAWSTAVARPFSPPPPPPPSAPPPPLQARLVPAAAARLSIGGGSRGLAGMGRGQEAGCYEAAQPLLGAGWQEGEGVEGVEGCGGLGGGLRGSRLAAPPLGAAGVAGLERPLEGLTMRA
ncbi:hypothetical protein HYH03_003541 [Edaphochlamys debaryana]|uniref:TLC domain-containing protein n=1 Tax=Edaphochlamys debaryana TaxID=47281 RepID=A0A836C304_9CHLO|nr:hypothetical protein HYH03_003541 [Edaphochlamys debaryana]|eukprot:KAG2498280.1 hypothetical protein HYH03_003541 [Edaphochlamys debaryana]